MIRIGRISYANVTPLFHALSEHFPCDGYRFTGGVPAHLNAMLAAGEIDVCPSSSIEYAVHPDRYLILPDVSISSTGAVASVLLFSRLPISELDGRTVLLSSESATSVNLLKILLQKRFGLTCRYAVTSLPPDEALRESPALLLIGDTALRAAMTADGLQVYDLGSLWHEWTGLPFVFALWFCTRSAAAERCRELQELAGQLVIAKRYAERDCAVIAATSPEMAWMGRERLIAYWRDNISYDLTADHVEGLKLFYRYSFELGLIGVNPQPEFLPMPA
ncbi:menaquinone biosynthesis protein [Geobacter sp. SVR]|uniref:menaquinone biosynthesis protein n=1 Tax=Geobacter sp. SVR TaxID=2495594 RepID=UPI00143EF4A8|nr:menaquinone biosynthesis protein [Geobacter sp. SVR]BCS54273.1 chorismate dehydratase [Geobacter sp. SVR]GCF85868.1 chorismate dehydratase [Geobacter sp. SVR]